MSIIKASCKWNGKKFDDIELDLSQPGIVFKTQLFSLTGVEPERQKTLVKGGMLKDDTDLTTLNIKPGHTFMMMGSVKPIVKAPEKPIQFLEDMDNDQIAMALNVPPGLENLGNTCYMSSISYQLNR